MKLDLKRKNKASNENWVHPHDPEARSAKMKDGRTHMAHKFEQAVDMETGAVVAATVRPMEGGDVASLPKTLDAATNGCESLGKSRRRSWPTRGITRTRP